MKDVYTISDLRENVITYECAPSFARLAVVGHPISHSVSPQMQQAALDQLGIDVRYIRLDIRPGCLAEAFDWMQTRGFTGCNITIPHKLDAMGICDVLTHEATVLGAVNTVIFRQGQVIGHNTDGPGLSAAILHDLGKALSDQRVLILGAGGGAGRAIAAQCAIEKSPAIHLSNRTESKLNPLAKQLSEISKSTEFHTLGVDRDSLNESISKVDLIINATSLGLQPDDSLPCSVDSITSSHSLYDIIYKPAITPWMAAANARGANTANGLSMLIHQGAIAFETWFDTTPDIDTMRAAIQ